MLANLWGTPAASVPAGVSSEGLPIGLHVVGNRHADDVVLRLARILEQSRPWPRHAPAVSDGRLIDSVQALCETRLFSVKCVKSGG